ncbi:MAG TPA: hypothetical protein PLB18_12460, partial [Acidobacteriota bacterium]|nr:hypothetical protein [Acidobacteriota bacterium]
RSIFATKVVVSKEGKNTARGELGKVLISQHNVNMECGSLMPLSDTPKKLFAARDQFNYFSTLITPNLAPASPQERKSGLNLPPLAEG